MRSRLYLIAISSAPHNRYGPRSISPRQSHRSRSFIAESLAPERIGEPRPKIPHFFFFESVESFGMPVRVRSFAKINLGLTIGAPRADGFHDLRTIYQTIALHDVIKIEVARGAGIEVRTK